MKTLTKHFGLVVGL